MVGLKIFDRQFPPSSRRPPVDVFVVVVLGIVAQSFEFVVLPNPSHPPHAHLTQPVGSGKQIVFGDLFHVGINIDRRFAWYLIEPLPKPEATVDSQVSLIHHKLATAGAGDGVFETRFAFRFERCRKIHDRSRELIRNAVAEIDLARARRKIGDLDVDVVRFSQRRHPQRVSDYRELFFGDQREDVSQTGKHDQYQNTRRDDTCDGDINLC